MSLRAPLVGLVVLAATLATPSVLALDPARVDSIDALPPALIMGGSVSVRSGAVGSTFVSCSDRSFDSEAVDMMCEADGLVLCCEFTPWIRVAQGYSGSVSHIGRTATGSYSLTCTAVAAGTSEAAKLKPMLGDAQPLCIFDKQGFFVPGQTLEIQGSASPPSIGGLEVGTYVR